jgi:hypothetical protein
MHDFNINRHQSAAKYNLYSCTLKYTQNRNIIAMKACNSNTKSSDVSLSVKAYLFLYVPQGLTLKNSTWCSLCVDCFVRVSEQTATFALYNIN